MQKITPRHDRTEPRPWIELFWGYAGWISLLCAAVLLVLTLVSVNAYRDANRLESDGQWTTAEIVRMRISSGDDSDSYFATFAYTVDDEVFAGEKNVGRSYYQQHDVGDHHDVHYWRQGPDLFELHVGDRKGNAILMQIIALVVGLIGCAALWYSGSKANKAVLARKLGVRTTARIERFVERKNSGTPTGAGYMIFRTADGLRGESLDRSMRELRKLGTGTDVIVYVRKGHVVWEGDVGPRANSPSMRPVVSGPRAE